MRWWAPLLVAALSGSGCAKARWHKSAELVRDTGVLVQLERHPEHRAPHPRAVDERALADELCALSYVDQMTVAAQRPVLPAWPCASARAVARGIAMGLSDAAPDERVRFWVRWEETDPALAWFVPHERHTRGVAYWGEDGLELIFDRVGELEGDGPRASRDPSENKTRRVRLVPPPGAERIVIDGKRQPLHLRWAALGLPARAEAPEDTEGQELQALSPEVQARLDLLSELHLAGEIDDDTYARRRRELLGAQP